MKIVITSAHEGKRLDLVLKNVLKKSRHQAALLIKSGSVTVNGKTSKAHYKTKKGDVIENVVPSPAYCLPARQGQAGGKKIPFKVIYEDPYLVAVNKPAGLLVHPTRSAKSEKTLIELIKNNIETPYLIHRLDRGTSGVILIAKDQKTQKLLQEKFAKRKIKKCYVALIRGHIEPEAGSIEAPLTRGKKNRTLIRVASGQKARYALTHYKVKKYLEDHYGEYSLLEVQIVTGRTHQIRVHFKSIGYPIVGDTQYGDPKLNKYFDQEYGLKRPFLHAKKIQFQYPRIKKLLHLEAEIPSILNKVLKKLKTEEKP